MTPSETKPLVEPIITPEILAERAEALVIKDQITYIEAIVAIADDLDVEPEDLGKLVKGPLKDKVEAEAQRAQLLPRSKTSILLFE